MMKSKVSEPIAQRPKALAMGEVLRRTIDNLIERDRL